MNIVYTIHARKRIIQKKIEEVWVEETIKYPDIIRKIEYGKYVLKKKINGGAIEVIIVRERDIKVITVYWL